MADGDLAAVFKGLAADAEQAGGTIADSAAELTEKTADIEEGNLARTLDAEAGNAKSFSDIGAEPPPEDEPLPAAPAGGDGEPPDESGGPPVAAGDAGHTPPSGSPDPDAVPGGPVTRIDDGHDADTKRSLGRENESARTLAKAGYQVEQNPRIPGKKNPDYRIEGEVFDNYAPTTGNPRNIASWIQEKVESGQTNRIVLNLADSPVDPAAMSAQLHDWPIPGLQEVKVIDRAGNVIDFYP